MGRRSVVLFGAAAASLVAVLALAQSKPGKPYGSTLAEKKLAPEYDKDGDHIEVNLRRLGEPTGTPTPIAHDRCAIRCTGAGFKWAVGGNWNPLTGEGSCACPGSGTDSYASGAGATASGDRASCAGDEASCTQDDTTCVGQAAACAFANSTCVGANCVPSGSSGTCLGSGCAAGEDAVGVGANVTAEEGCVGIGNGVNCTGNGNIFLGSSHTGITGYQMFLAPSQFGAAPLFSSIQPQSGSGSNIAGADFRIRGGRSTGSGVGGDIIFQTSSGGSSGSTLNATTERWLVAGSNGALAPVADDTVDLGTESEQARNIYAHAIGGLLAPVEEVNTLDVRSTSGFNWSVPFGVRETITGGSCSNTAELVTSGGIHAPAIACTDSNSDLFYWTWPAPGNFAGNSVLVTFTVVNTDLGATGVMAYDVSCGCAGNNEAASYGTAADIDISFNLPEINEMEDNTVTCGTCSGGDIVYFRAQVDATSTTTSTPEDDVRLTGIKVQYVRGQSLFE